MRRGGEEERQRRTGCTVKVRIPYKDAGNIRSEMLLFKSRTMQILSFEVMLKHNHHLANTGWRTKGQIWPNVDSIIEPQIQSELFRGKSCQPQRFRSTLPKTASRLSFQQARHGAGCLPGLPKRSV